MKAKRPNSQRRNIKNIKRGKKRWQLTLYMCSPFLRLYRTEFADQVDYS